MAIALLPLRRDEEQSSLMNVTPIDDPTLNYSNWHSNAQFFPFRRLVYASFGSNINEMGFSVLQAYAKTTYSSGTLHYKNTCVCGNR